MVPGRADGDHARSSGVHPTHRPGARGPGRDRRWRAGGRDRRAHEDHDEVGRQPQAAHLRQARSAESGAGGAGRPGIRRTAIRDAAIAPPRARGARGHPVAPAGGGARRRSGIGPEIQVAVATSLDELTAVCDRLDPDVVLSATHYPDGDPLPVLTEVLGRGRRVLLMAEADESEAVHALLFAGASGCLLWSDAEPETRRDRGPGGRRGRRSPAPRGGRRGARTMAGDARSATSITPEPPGEPSGPEWSDADPARDRSAARPRAWSADEIDRPRAVGLAEDRRGAHRPPARETRRADAHSGRIGPPENADWCDGAGRGTRSRGPGLLDRAHGASSERQGYRCCRRSGTWPE